MINVWEIHRWKAPIDRWESKGPPRIKPHRRWWVLKIDGLRWAWRMHQHLAHHSQRCFFGHHCQSNLHPLYLRHCRRRNQHGARRLPFGPRRNQIHQIRGIEVVVWSWQSFERREKRSHRYISCKGVQFVGFQPHCRSLCD